ncbi:MAG TPA: hypothetical protein VFH56_17065, partial [Acidimicrobiales bacterium]|nr:hypothetical protein [Acidimicrobiales bacterium]
GGRRRMTAAAEVQVLSASSSREELVAALTAVSAEAGRELQRDHLGRPNERWASLHSFLNTLLDFLDEE